MIYDLLVYVTSAFIVVSLIMAWMDAENQRRRGNLMRDSELETCSPVKVVAVAPGSKTSPGQRRLSPFDLRPTEQATTAGNQKTRNANDQMRLWGKGVYGVSI